MSTNYIILYIGKKKAFFFQFQITNLKVNF